MNYIIVDDESAAHHIIEDFASNIPYLVKKGNCYNAIEAIELIKLQKVDLMFLDINMPKISGFEFLKSLRNPPKVIVTTAFQEHALEGYELDVVDYLLKPFGFDRFFKAIQKVQDLSLSNSYDSTKHESTIFIKSERKFHQVKFSDILFLEAKGNYVQVHLKSGRLMTYSSLSDISKSLPEDDFIRVHKSFIVSKDCVTSLDSNRIYIGENLIPIGQNYKKFVQSKLGIQK